MKGRRGRNGKKRERTQVQRQASARRANGRDGDRGDISGGNLRRNGRERLRGLPNTGKRKTPPQEAVQISPSDMTLAAWQLGKGDADSDAHQHR